MAQPHYARVFQVVEVQQTFYQVPRITTLARWRERLPNPFEFTLKAWQLITHEALSPTYRRLSERFTASQMRRCGAFQPIAEVREAWEHTAASARALGAGVILFQCPASFVPTAEHLENLRHFFGGVDRGAFILVWKPRGRWQASVVRRLYRELDLIHAVDPTEREPVAGEFRYFRLHGRGGYRYRYTDADLESLARLCRGQKPADVFFNNVSMWGDAQRFQNLWKRSKAVR